MGRSKAIIPRRGRAASSAAATASAENLNDVFIESDDPPPTQTNPPELVTQDQNLTPTDTVDVTLETLDADESPPTQTLPVEAPNEPNDPQMAPDPEQSHQDDDPDDGLNRLLASVDTDDSNSSISDSSLDSNLSSGTKKLRRKRHKMKYQWNLLRHLKRQARIKYTTATPTPATTNQTNALEILKLCKIRARERRVGSRKTPTSGGQVRAGKNNDGTIQRGKRN